MRFGQRVHLTGIGDRDRGAVDEQRCRTRGGQHVGVAAPDHLAGGQHGDDHVGLGHRFGRATKHRDTVRGGAGRRRGCRVESTHDVARTNQIRRHRRTHVAQT